jgi:ribosome-associated protein
VVLAPGVRVAAAVLRFSAETSGGPGGQHANRRHTRAVLRVRLLDLPITPGALARLTSNPGARVVGEGDDAEVLLSDASTRSLERNKRRCLDRLGELLVIARRPPVPRRPTRPTRGSIERRLRAKRENAQRKQTRRKPGDDA